MWVKFTVYFGRNDPSEMLAIPSPTEMNLECVPRKGDTVIVPGATDRSEEPLIVTQVIWIPFRVGKEGVIVVLGARG